MADAADAPPALPTRWLMSDITKCDSGCDAITSALRACRHYCVGYRLRHAIAVEMPPFRHTFRLLLLLT